MNSKSIEAFFIVALLATSCLAQTPAPFPTTTASTTTPPPIPTATPPSTSAYPSFDVPNASPPAPEGPGVSPGDLSPTLSDATAPPTNAAFSNKVFIAGTSLAAIIYAVVLAAIIYTIECV